jgi:predicted negative regulator of RcsB-dependent stress response
VKIASLFLLLAVLVYVGWENHVKHDRQQQNEAHERFEGYDRCVAPLDESLAYNAMAPNWNRESPEAKETLRRWQKARDGCRDFYFARK